MSQQKKKSNFLKREVKFGGKTVILYSIDGNTWSTRKDELQAIIDRHEAEKVTFGEIKGGLGAGAKAAAAARKDEADKAAKARAASADDEAIDDLKMIDDDVVDDIDDNTDEKAAGKRGRPAISVGKAPSPASKIVAAKAKHLKQVENTARLESPKAKAGKITQKKKEVSKPKAAAPKARVSGAPAKSKTKPKSKRAA
jgi:hypothetical protein